MSRLTGRLKILKFSAPAFEDILKQNHQGKLLEVTKGIPEDAELIKIEPTTKGVYNLIFKSSQFDIVKDTEPIPEMDQVEFISHSKELLEDEQ